MERFPGTVADNLYSVTLCSWATHPSRHLTTCSQESKEPARHLAQLEFMEFLMQKEINYFSDKYSQFLKILPFSIFIFVSPS